MVTSKRRHSANRAEARAWRALCREAAACRACTDMDGGRAVLSDANGSLDAPVVFVGEAPGRRGAHRTGVPFTGDASGRRFDELLAAANLTRHDVLITNAVLCCPRITRANRRPTAAEIARCSDFLRRTLDLVRPRVVATLGSVALHALGAILGQRLRLRDCVGTAIDAGPYLLLPLYHPSPRVLNTTRSLDQQQADFRRLGRLLRSLPAEPATPRRAHDGKRPTRPPATCSEHPASAVS
jgi:uracil-DNA glycosylase family 4